MRKRRVANDFFPPGCLLWRAWMRASTGVGAFTGTVLVAVAFALLDATLSPPGHSWGARFLNALLAGVLAIIGIYGLRLLWGLSSYRRNRRDDIWCTRGVIFSHGLDMALENKPGVPPTAFTDLGAIECYVQTDRGQFATAPAFCPGGITTTVKAQPQLPAAHSYEVRWYGTWHGRRFEVCRGQLVVHGTFAILIEPEGHTCFAGVPARKP